MRPAGGMPLRVRLGDGLGLIGEKLRVRWIRVLPLNALLNEVLTSLIQLHLRRQIDRHIATVCTFIGTTKGHQALQHSVGFVSVLHRRIKDDSDGAMARLPDDMCERCEAFGGIERSVNGVLPRDRVRIERRVVQLVFVIPKGCRPERFNLC